MLVLKPVDSKLENSYLKYFQTKHKLDLKMVNELKDYFGDDFYYILTLFAGVKVDFKKLEVLEEWKSFVNIYHDVINFMESGVIFEEAITKVASKYHLTDNKTFCIYSDVLSVINS